MGLLKKTVAVLEAKQVELREEFKASDAFNFDCADSYAKCDAVSGSFYMGFWWGLFWDKELEEKVFFVGVFGFVGVGRVKWFLGVFWFYFVVL